MIWFACQWAAVALFVLGSAVISSRYIYTTTEHIGVPVALAFAALMVAVELTKPASVRAAFGYSGRAMIVPGIVGAVLCVTVSGFVELQAMARGRGEYVRQIDDGGAKDALASRREHWQKELASLGPTRTVEELRPLIVKCEGERRCDSSKLKSEKGRAERKADLETKIASLYNRTDSIVKASDEAQALVSVFARAGWTVSAVDIDRLIGPVLVAMVQLSAVVASAIAQPLPARENQPVQTGGRLNVQRFRLSPWKQKECPQPLGGRNEVADAEISATAKQSPLAIENKVADKVADDIWNDESSNGEDERKREESKAVILAVLEKAGGEMIGGWRQLGQAWKLRRHSALTLCGELERDGLIEVEELEKWRGVRVTLKEGKKG